MNKTVLATLAFAAGTGFGFVVGYYMVNKKANAQDKEFVEPIYVEKPEKPEPEKPQEEKFVSRPARLAKKPGEVGINYTEYVKELKYKQESQSPPEDESKEDGEETENDISEEGGDEIDMSQFEETFEERVEREAEEALEHSEQYKREHKGKIDLMPADEWDSDFAETDYEREDLYYFTESDILTDEDGNQLDEEEYISNKVRRVGWMQSPDENIYVRNHPKQKEYRIFKERCSVEDWF